MWHDYTGPHPPNVVTLGGPWLSGMIVAESADSLVFHRAHGNGPSGFYFTIPLEHELQPRDE